MAVSRTRIGVLSLLIAGCSAAGPAASPSPARAEAGAETGAKASRPPLLLPEDPALRRSVRVADFGRGYTASMASGGITVQITGLPLETRVAPLFVQRTAYGIDASFSRDDGLYSLTLTCDRPDDARCADERFIRSLIGGLARQ